MSILLCNICNSANWTYKKLSHSLRILVRVARFAEQNPRQKGDVFFSPFLSTFTLEVNSKFFLRSDLPILVVHVQNYK